MRPIAIICLLALSGCGKVGMADLRAFVAETGKDLQGKIEPLPQVKAYEPFTYEAFDLPDPFKPRKLATVAGGGGPQPDMTRPREPLEAFSLETLKMVGKVSRKGKVHAVIRTPDNTVYHVGKGNYVGQNFGLITHIGESDVTLREIIQDSAGDWSERISTLVLQE